jgi:hypothetical protein
MPSQKRQTARWAKCQTCRTPVGSQASPAWDLAGGTFCSKCIPEDVQKAQRASAATKTAVQAPPEPEPSDSDYERAEAFLLSYDGTFAFLLDIRQRVTAGTTMSPRQVAAVLRCAARERTPETKPEPEETSIPNGTYTVVLDDGSHVTLRLKDWNEKRIATYLAGSDNDSDYVGFAFINGTRINLWKRFQNNSISRIALALETLLTGDPGEAGLRYSMESGNCYRCGRTLTVPASIHRGLGPECASKM